MKIILEKSLDFMQFQNLIILLFVLISLLFIAINPNDLTDHLLLSIPLMIAIIVGSAILFTKKGLVIEENKLYKSIFLFNFILYKKLIQSEFEKITILHGRLSTNYNYSYDKREMHHWEPNLNISVKCFSITLLSENHRQKTKVITLVNANKAEEAIVFITKNSSIKYEKYSPS